MARREPPEGFVDNDSDQINYGEAESWYQLVGPLFYARDNQPGQVRLSFFSEPRYISSMGRVHGGKMSSFMDYLLFSAAYSAWVDSPLVTVSLNINFVSACPPQVWVVGHGQVVQAGNSMAFVQGVVKAQDRVIVHGTGTFRKLSNQPPVTDS